MIFEIPLDQGDLSAALESDRAAMSITERLAAADPNNAGWQRDLSIGYQRVGDLEEARGDIGVAIAAQEKSLPVAQSLADWFPGNPQFQSNIAGAHTRLTQLRAKLGGCPRTKASTMCPAVHGLPRLDDYSPLLAGVLLDE